MQLIPDDGHANVSTPSPRFSLKNITNNICTDVFLKFLRIITLQVRSEISNMCTSLYRELMQSCLGGIQPVVINQMCNMAQVMWAGLSKHDGGGMGRAHAAGCSHCRSIGGDSTDNHMPRNNDLQTEAARPGCSQTPDAHGDATTDGSPTDTGNGAHIVADIVGCPDIRSADYGPVANNISAPTKTDEQFHAVNSVQTKSAHKESSENTTSHDTIQCAQRYAYIYPEPTSVENHSGVNGGTSHSKEHSNDKRTNAFEALEILKMYEDHDDTCSSWRETPVEEATLHIQDFSNDIVPDSYERSCNVLDKTLESRRFRRRLTEDIGASKRCKKLRSFNISSMEEGNKDGSHEGWSEFNGDQIEPHNNRVTTIANLRCTKDSSDSAQDAHVALILHRMHLGIEVGNQDKAYMPLDLTTRERGNGDAANTNIENLVQFIQNLMCTNDNSGHRIQVFLFKLKVTTMSASMLLGILCSSVYCEAFNADYTDNPNLRPSKCFLTSDIVVSCMI